MPEIKEATASSRLNELLNKTNPKRNAHLLGIALGVVLLLGIIMLVVFGNGCVSARSAMPIPINFLGEYSQNGG